MSKAQLETRPYVEAFRRFEKGFNGDRGDWLHGVRRRAIESFETLGFPTTKSEDWRYTSLAGFAETVFAATSKPAGGVEPVGVPDVDWPRLAFVNGFFAGEQSDVSSVPAGVTVRPLSETWGAERLAGLTEVAPFEAEAFNALNTAMFADGALIAIDPGVELTTPIHLVFISDAAGQAVASHPRVLIKAGANSRAVVLETHVGRGGPYLANVVAEVELEPGAQVTHHKLQRDSDDAHHVAFTAVRQARDSRYISGSLLLGGSVTRQVISISLHEPGASCLLDGLGLGRRRQHLDVQTVVEHAVPNCSSNQLVKTVLDDSATAVFNGKVVVRPHADGTDAVQNNRNLLLARSATANTRPQLEIYADDVKCVHGATVGQIDEHALFYLRSRGIDAPRARALLTYSFALEVIERIEHEPIRDLLRIAASDWLEADTGVEVRP